MNRNLSVALLAATIVACSSQSAMLTNDSGHSVKCENWGFGIIGAPVAMANQSDCVKKANEAGYHEAGKPAAPTTALKLSPNASKLDLAFPAGWQTKPVPDVLRSRGFVIVANNATTDSSVAASAAEVSGITDLEAYIKSRRADQESRLKETSHSDIADITVNGRPAKQFNVTGTNAQGARLTYLDTYIFGQTEVVSVNAWTTTPNFTDQQASLQGLAERISGIQ